MNNEGTSTMLVYALFSHILKNAAVTTKVHRSHDRVHVQKRFQLEGFNIFSIYLKKEYRKATDISLSRYCRPILDSSASAFMLSDMCRVKYFFSIDNNAVKQASD